MGSPSHSSSGSIPIPTGLRNRSPTPRRKPLAQASLAYEDAEALLRLHAQRVAGKTPIPESPAEVIEAPADPVPPAVATSIAGRVRITDLLAIAIAWAGLFFAAAIVPLLAPPVLVTGVGLALTISGALIALFPDRIRQLEGLLTGRQATDMGVERLVMRLVGIGAIVTAWWMV